MKTTAIVHLPQAATVALLQRPRRPRGIFPLFRAVEKADADRFSIAFLMGLLEGPATADEIRERLGILGTNEIGRSVSALHRAGLIRVTDYARATGAKAHSRLTRLWALSDAGRAEAQRLAAGGVR